MVRRVFLPFRCREPNRKPLSKLPLKFNLATAIQEIVNDDLKRSSYVRDGIAGNFDVVAKMIRLIRDSVMLDIGFSDFAAKILVDADLSANSDTEEIFTAIYNFIRDHVSYIQDIQGRIERIKDARTTIQDGFGDCDDIAILFATILADLGYEPKIVLARYGANSENFQHVYTSVILNGQRYVFDGTLKDGVFNMEVPADTIVEVGVFDYVNGVDGVTGIVNGVKDVAAQTINNGLAATDILGSFLPLGTIPTYVLSAGAAMLGKIGKGVKGIDDVESLSELGSRINGRLHDIIIQLQMRKISVEIAEAQATQASAQWFWINSGIRNTEIYKTIDKQIADKIDYIKNFGTNFPNLAIRLNPELLKILGVAAVGFVLLYLIKK